MKRDRLLVVECAPARRRACRGVIYAATAGAAGPARPDAAGNLEEAREWEGRGQHFREARHRRRMDFLHSPVEAAKGAAVSAGTGVGLLVALGVCMAIATKDATEVITPLMAVIKFINLMITIVQVVWGPALSIGPFLALLALWSVGAH